VCVCVCVCVLVGGGGPGGGEGVASSVGGDDLEIRLTLERGEWFLAARKCVSPVGFKACPQHPTQRRNDNNNGTRLMRLMK
jgi:hypothetical protein